MKIKIIEDPRWSINQDNVTLEDLINEFIKDKKVIDVKYQSNCSESTDSDIQNTDYKHSVLIMYENNKVTEPTSVVDRVKHERDELEEKMIKLQLFLANKEKTSNIPQEQLQLLKSQADVMNKYWALLGNRLYYLEKEK